MGYQPPKPNGMRELTVVPAYPVPEEDDEDGDGPLDMAAVRADCRAALATRLMNSADRECSPEVYVNEQAARLAIHCSRLLAENAALRAELATARAKGATRGD